MEAFSEDEPINAIVVFTHGNGAQVLCTPMSPSEIIGTLEVAKHGVMRSVTERPEV